MLVIAVEHQVMTTYSSFGLMGDGDVDVLNLSMTAVVECGAGLCLFRSGASDHTADVRIEIWDSTPEPASGWDEAEYGSNELDATRFELQSLAVTNDISVPIPGLPRIPIQPIHYTVQAWVLGRARARQSHSYGETGLERWLIRLSPRS
ncbi:hypothetical protein [Jiangella alkaliphila]|uniref:Uncharacterized protein n=1 Tax=Jiangella alkaliphila TaxID=419479 RepID=A0A1H2L8E0_9ACTN|nr:hypothetical protein [Jiangella alkaliphila]SDU77104.1 hypothetical protein SAMN04488563_5420 [Jiangella alkaliphila]